VFISTLNSLKYVSVVLQMFQTSALQKHVLWTFVRVSSSSGSATYRQLLTLY